MDRGAWWATVHEVYKESVMTEQLILSYFHFFPQTVSYEIVSLSFTHTHTHTHEVCSKIHERCIFKTKKRKKEIYIYIFLNELFLAPLCYLNSKTLTQGNNQIILNHTVTLESEIWGEIWESI